MVLPLNSSEAARSSGTGSPLTTGPLKIEGEAPNFCGSGGGTFLNPAVGKRGSLYKVVTFCLKLDRKSETEMLSKVRWPSNVHPL
jgi:hypothetical protein